MKYLDEFRDPVAAKGLAQQIEDITKHDWTIMEICGGQTHSIVRHGIDHILPSRIRLVHGPGCPVCVTPLEKIDRALELALKPNVIFASFGDMLRVPGSKLDLLSAKAKGADVRIVYGPLDAVKIAQANPDKHVVFFAVGFETTAPANAMAVLQAKQQNIDNFSMLVSHVLVPPAMETILGSPNNQVQGFLAAGHVCTVMGYKEYEPIAEKYRVPIIVTGFEPLDILQGIYLCVKQLEEKRFGVDNQYARSVHRDGNQAAMNAMTEVFTIENNKWRGIGEIPKSGLKIKPEHAQYDAEQRFELATRNVEEPKECISGLILQGLKKPAECPAFGTQCTPEHPLGATMVSNEGACAAYFQHRGS